MARALTDRGGHVGQQESQALVVDDLAAERRSLVGVADGLVESGLREPTATAAMPSRPESSARERDLQTLTFGADQPVFVDVGWS